MKKKTNKQNEKENTYVFQYANGMTSARGVSVEDACSHIKVNPDKIITGFLVRVRRMIDVSWSYWDAEMFWKFLKNGEECRKQKEKEKVK